jgi:hypothetical protein
MPTIREITIPEDEYAALCALRAEANEINEAAMDSYWNKWASTQDHRAAVKAYLTHIAR